MEGGGSGMEGGECCLSQRGGGLRGWGVLAVIGVSVHVSPPAMQTMTPQQGDCKVRGGQDPCAPLYVLA